MNITNYKRLVAVITTTVMCVTCLNTSAFASSDNTASEEVARGTQVLLASGWTQAQIDDLIPEEAIRQFADASPAINTDVTYLKISEEGTVTELSKQECLREAENTLKEQAIARANIPEGGTGEDAQNSNEGYLNYWIQAYHVSGADYILSARYEWLVNPVDNKIDVFGLGHSEQLTQQGSISDVFYAYKADIYLRAAGDETFYQTHETDSPTSINADIGGTGVSQDLMEGVPTSGTGYSYVARKCRGYIQYDAMVNNLSATSVSVKAEYLHQEYFFSYAPSISYPYGASLSVTEESRFKRLNPNPYFAFSV